MTAFRDIQNALDRILGENPAGNHGAFWRGKTRDQFIADQVFGFQIVEVGDPENSHLVNAIKARAPFGSDLVPPTPNSFVRRMPAGLPPADEADISLIEEWITAGCPDDTGPLTALLTATPVDDETHMRYWREIDHFFLPSLADPETRTHVNRLHLPAFQAWRQTNLTSHGANVWRDFVNNPENQQSFEFIRLHQRRIIDTFYGASQFSLLESLWKFGGDLLPRDADSRAEPEHRMNGLLDWFVWIPYLEMSLTADDVNSMDLALARGWQVGLAADGLLRSDEGRPNPISIPEFDTADPNLFETVALFFMSMDSNSLVERTIARAKTFFGTSG